MNALDYLTIGIVYGLSLGTVVGWVMHLRQRAMKEQEREDWEAVIAQESIK